MLRTKILTGLLFLVGLISPVLAHATACPTGYSNSKVFYIDTQQFGSTLTGFPVLLAYNGVTQSVTTLSGEVTSYTLPDLKASGSGGKILSSGNDIVFCDALSGGNLLNFQRRVYTGTTGAAEFYVGRTLVPSTTPTAIWMFYGKASDSDHSNNAAVCTASHYVFMEGYGNGSTLDLTDWCGTYTPVNNGATATTGYIAGGASMLASGPQYIDAGASITSTVVTAEGWIKPTSNNSCKTIVGNNDGNNGFRLNAGSVGSGGGGCNGGETGVSFDVNNGGSDTFMFTPAQVIQNSVWTFVAGVGGYGGVSLAYVNGINQTVNVTTSGTGTMGNSSLNINIGRDPHNFGGAFGNLPMNGSVDEVRVANVAQSADWESANFQTQSNPTGFAVMTDAITPTGMTSGAYCIPLTINHTQIPNTDQTNFPLLVRGTYPWMAYTSSGGFAVNGNGGKDIQFFSNSTCSTALSFERVFYTSSTGDSAWRVEIPTASHTSDTTVYVKIGLSTDTSDNSTLWMGGTNFAGAYEGGAPGVLGTTDSGGSGLDIGQTATGAGASIAPAATQLGGGFYIGGLTDAFTPGWCPIASGDSIGAHGFPTGTGVVNHQSIWFKTSPSALGPILGGGNSQNISGYGKANNGVGDQSGITMFAQLSNGQPFYYTALGETGIDFNTAGAPVITSASSLNPGPSSPTFLVDYGWHRFDFDYATPGGAISTATILIDGIPITSPALANGTVVPVIDNSPNTSPGSCVGVAELRLGRDAAHGNAHYQGYVTGWEVSNVARSADNDAARFNNEFNPSVFYSFGTASPISPPGSHANQPPAQVIGKLETPNTTWEAIK
jgi:hypothetical protein